MKTVKTLLLGSAAAFAAFTGAQAADLPGAEPVEYVKVCSTYGEGFFYIPGTDTCLQIGGYVRFDMQYNGGNGDDDDTDFVGGAADDDFFTNARGTVTVDARSETEWGTLRSYIEYEGNFSSGAYDDGVSDLHLEAGFIQFAGITAGKASSFYDFVNAATFSDFFSAESVNTLAYTASFGSGFAATIAMEDKYFRGRPGLALVGVDLDDDGVDDIAVFDGTETGLDQTFPNFVAALRVDQAWGSAAISAAVQDNEADIGQGDDLGFAVQAGVKLNAGFLSEGSYIWAQGAYSEGATSYAGAEDVLNNGLNFDFDFVRDTSLNGENNEMWQAGGGVTWQATKTVAFNGAATYVSFDSDDFGEFNYIHAEGNVFWTPVKNLDLGLGVIYGKIVDADIDAGTPTNFGEDDDDLIVQGRIQRSF